MGSINIDNTGSGSGITLSSDGTDLLLDGTAVGGGGDPDLYRDNASGATTPTASGTNAVAIGTNAQATNTNAVAITRNAVASGISSFAVGNNAAATSTNAIAIGSNTDATERAVAIGGAGAQALQQNTTAIGSSSSSQPATCPSGGGAGAIALGGSYATGTDSLAAAIANNTSSYGASQTSTIAIGYQAKASNTYAVAIGRTAIAQGDTSLALGEAQASGVRSVAIGTTTSSGKGATALYSIAIGYNSSSTGTGGFAAGVEADVNNQYAIAGPYARGWGNYGVAFGFEAQSEANHAVSIGSSSGANGARNTGAGAVVLGGSHASGTDSFAAAIANNSSSYGAKNANSVALGYQTQGSSSNAVALGNASIASGSNSFAAGWAQQASGSQSVCLGGNSSLASGANSFSVGRANTSSGQYSTTLGNANQATKKASVGIGDGAWSKLHGKFVYTGTAGGGKSQYGNMVLTRVTADATATILTSDDSTPSAINQVVLENNSAYAFHGTIVARQQAADGTACAAWKVEGLIRREGSAGTTVLVNSATTVLDNTPSWGMALSADTTNGGLAITVTGAASTDIRWVATIHTSEVIYA